MQTHGAASLQVNPVDRQKVTACRGKFLALAHIVLQIHHQISQMSVKRSLSPRFQLLLALPLIFLCLHKEFDHAGITQASLIESLLSVSSQQSTKVWGRSTGVGCSSHPNNKSKDICCLLAAVSIN